MTSFTPGPWVFSKQTGYRVRFSIAQAQGATYTPDYSDVATLIADTSIGEREAVQEANARLIAAAPDLLAALQGVQTMANCGQLDEFLGEPWLKAVTTAIAKATA